MADTPVINGHKYSWASIEAHIGGVPAREFTEINYSTKAEPGSVKGFGSRRIGRTRGEIEHEGSITMSKRAANEFLARLGTGATTKAFDVVVSYDETGEGGVITDTLRGCRVKNIDNAHKQGGDGLSVKFDLDVMSILYNGIDVGGDK